MLLVITFNQILTAFLGALIALLLKAGYDAVVEHRRLETIRKMIYTDLVLQEKKLKVHITEYDSMIEAFKGESSNIGVSHYNLINTNIYKAHTEKDYFKAFKTDEFNDLMEIYINLKEMEKFDVKAFIEVYESKRAELRAARNFEGIDTLDDRYLNRAGVKRGTVISTIIRVETFLTKYKTTYPDYLY
ncbi:hypothetical protein [uncultured Pontibacter sp.]|uniref:hypothetical protein n=1 Tax=uncultured Pontibacter sp. TaxID=453356 RepID=UPI002605702F|nr:hypothetical protein [uncultured Pontibacter sp.]